MKDSFYFQHDYNSANDQRILKLRAKFNNAEGYGVYFMILEAMAQEESGILENDCMAQLSLSYGLAINQLKEVINYCIEIGLFVQDKKGFFSKRMIEHKQFRKERSLSGKKGAESRWDDSSAMAEPMAEPMQRKGKDSKGKKSKVKDTKKEINKEKNFVNKTSKELSNLKNLKEKNNLYELSEDDLEKIAKQYNVPISFVASKYEDMIDWHESTGKVRKNWVATLRGFVKRSAIERIDYAKKSNQYQAIDASGI